MIFYYNCFALPIAFWMPVASTTSAANALAVARSGNSNSKRRRGSFQIASSTSASMRALSTSRASCSMRSTSSTAACSSSSSALACLSTTTAAATSGCWFPCPFSFMARTTSPCSFTRRSAMSNCSRVGRHSRASARSRSSSKSFCTYRTSSSSTRCAPCLVATSTTHALSGASTCFSTLSGLVSTPTWSFDSDPEPLCRHIDGTAIASHQSSHVFTSGAPPLSRLYPVPFVHTYPARCLATSKSFASSALSL
mmetsp:Transcript_1113/g.3093  ORF Transcript_1113/g.3093 Transcript_1113/m.3093 type:complete len:253 (-) Transcript_1113:240-998(-)